LSYKHVRKIAIVSSPIDGRGIQSKEDTMHIIWDFLTILLTIGSLYGGREYRIIRARARAQNWGNF